MKRAILSERLCSCHEGKAIVHQASCQCSNRGPNSSVRRMHTLYVFDSLCLVFIDCLANKAVIVVVVVIVVIVVVVIVVVIF